MRSIVRMAGGLLIIAACAVFTGCGRDANKYVAPPPPEVTVSRPVERTVTNYLEARGTTAAIEFVDIRARVQGYLQEMYFQPRATVKKGDLLFQIDPKPFQAKVDQAQASVEGAAATLNLAQVELNKSQELFEKAAVSEIETIKKKAERDKAAADLEMAKANLEEAKLNLGYTKVTSPTDGQVSRNFVDVGNLVGATEKTLLATVVNDRSIYVYFSLSEIELMPIIRKYSEEAKEIPREERLKEEPTPAFVGLEDEQGYPHEGRIDYADTSVDSKTGTLQLRGIFSNPTGLMIPGMFVRVRVPVTTNRALLVPDVAVLADQGGRYVLVVDDKNKVHRKNVNLGATINHLRVILGGIKGKDWVVVDGVQKARPGSTVKPIRKALKPAEDESKPESPAKTKKPETTKSPESAPEARKQNPKADKAPAKKPGSGSKSGVNQKPSQDKSGQ